MKPLTKIQDTSGLVSISEIEPYDISEEFDEIVHPPLLEIHEHLNKAHIPHIVSVGTRVNHIEPGRFTGSQKFYSGNVSPARDMPLAVAHVAVTSSSSAEIAMRITEIFTADSEMLYAMALVLDRHGINVELPTPSRPTIN